MEPEFSALNMFHISNCCRACMKADSSLLSLYENIMVDQQVFLIAEALMNCTGMTVMQDDGLPNRICHDCAKTLETICAFKIRALVSETEFKKLINSTPNGIKDQVIKSEMKLEEDDDIGNGDLLLEDLSEYTPLDLPKQECDTKICFDDMVSQTQTYNCELCSKKYTKEDKYLKHMKSHENPMYCDICKDVFYNKRTLNKHIKNHSSGVFKCDYCDEEFDLEALFLEHVASHAEKVNVKCPKCEVLFSRRGAFITHLRKVHENKIKCDICQKDYSTKSLLKRHMKLHRNERPYQCTKCAKSYSRHDQLLQHMKWHDGIKPYICSFCSKAFNQLCSLKDHIRTHTGETPYLCSECGKSFTNSSNLRQHLMRHSGVKPFKCNLCPKSFTTKGQMTSHLTTHTGVHPYKCEQCESTFTKANSLKKHKLIHLGIKPFPCDSCNMRFSCKEHLKRHNRIHTGEKPYKCQYCERAFSQSNDLAKHIRTHVGQNIYQCTVCSMRFRLISELKQHYPTHYVNGDDIPKIPISKGVEAPVLMIKPEESTPVVTCDPRITITINSNGLDKNGLAGDITIDLSPDKS
ncbi:zinc finger protein 883 [Amyelois transitella]|uniref:zinc finger protein 883 n=1 Tax=Amyelois transitella TaxID=680683 RepID=UPI0029903AA2|nr:zinc finger protein 883 [Amyelois transitella]